MNIMISHFDGKNEGRIWVCALVGRAVSRGVATDSAQPRRPPRRHTAFPASPLTLIPILRTLRSSHPRTPPALQGRRRRVYRILLAFLRKLEFSLDINTQKFHIACHYHATSILSSCHLISLMMESLIQNINNNQSTHSLHKEIRI